MNCYPNDEIRIYTWKKAKKYLKYLSGNFYCLCQGDCHGLRFWLCYFLFYSVVLSPCDMFHFPLLPFVCCLTLFSVYTCVSLVNYPLWVFPLVFVGLSVSVLCFLLCLPILFSCILLPDSSCYSSLYFVFVLHRFCWLTFACLLLPLFWIWIFGLSLKLLVFNLPGFQMSAFGSLCVKPDRGYVFSGVFCFVSWSVGKFTCEFFLRICGSTLL